MDVYNTALFYSNLIGNRLLSFSFEKPLDASHLKPIEDFLFDGKELTPFSQELFTYQEARNCVLDFDIYTIQKKWRVACSISISITAGSASLTGPQTGLRSQ